MDARQAMVDLMAKQAIRSGRGMDADEEEEEEELEITEEELGMSGRSERMSSVHVHARTTTQPTEQSRDRLFGSSLTGECAPWWRASAWLLACRWVCKKKEIFLLRFLPASFPPPPHSFFLQTHENM